MENYIPLKKRSKKEQKRFFDKQRGSWYGVDPVTRIERSKKIYNRAARKRKDREIFERGDFE